MTNAATDVAHFGEFCHLIFVGRTPEYPVSWTSSSMPDCGRIRLGLIRVGALLEVGRVGVPPPPHKG